MKKKNLNRTGIIVRALALWTLTSCLLNTINPPKKSDWTVGTINVSGTKNVSAEGVILASGLSVGKPFSLLRQNSVRSIYNLGFFDDVSLEARVSGVGTLDVNIEVKEKPLISGYEFIGNRAVSLKKILKVTKIDSRRAIDHHDIEVIKARIVREYRNLNYLNVVVKAMRKLSPDKARAFIKFDIQEGVKTKLTRVFIVGCHNVPEEEIRNKILTKESWIFSFVDQSGRVNGDIIEQDKRIIKELYANHGYINAMVEDVDIKTDEQDNTAEVTFYINEGVQAKINSITLPFDDECPRGLMLRSLAINRGETYSKAAVIKSMDNLKSLFNNRGYLYCDAYPDIQPVNGSWDAVDINFILEKGKQYYIDGVTVSGNRQTKNKVILREVGLNSGDLASKLDMEMAKQSVESTGYFEREGVDWQIKRIGDDRVNLNLNVKEAKVNSFNFQLSYGADRASSEASTSLSLDLQRRNLYGSGWDTGVGVTLGKNRLQRADFNIFTPYIFDRAISLSNNLYFSRLTYEDLGMAVEKHPREVSVGAATRIGFSLFPDDLRVKTLVEVGCEGFSYNTVENGFIDQELIPENRKYDIEPAFKLSRYNSPAFNEFVKQERFKDGFIYWLGMGMSKSTVNHPLYPSCGWKLELFNKLVPPVFINFAFLKTELTGDYFFPIIGNDRLVFSSRLKLGLIKQFTTARGIPYKELYNVGGTDSIRGFRWGEAGPLGRENYMPLGASKQFVARFELVTPMGFDKDIHVHTPRAFAFYDLGCGWDTPLGRKPLPKNELRNNSMHPRHVVGFGFKMVYPMPLKLEWGYKLDRRYLSFERPSELHITAQHSF